jgi:transposase
MSTPPSTPKRKRLNRDQRRGILLLRRRGDSYEHIAQFLGVSFHAVQHTCTIQKATPQHKRAGRPSKLTSEEADQFIEYVKTSKRNRRLTYQQLKHELYKKRDDISTVAIEYALHKRGYFRHLALRKAPISERNRICRLEWALEHLHWSQE